ncbi:MAG: hypothetical protein IKX50_06495, partial [Spirochaetia bacterium]|nr:hypothetical protein [Spirochaetia bacterium]
MDLTDEVDKQLYGTTWKNTVAYNAIFARDRVHFPDDKSLERAKDFILEAIKKKPTTAEIIALLKEEQAA